MRGEGNSRRYSTTPKINKVRIFIIPFFVQISLEIRQFHNISLDKTIKLDPTTLNAIFSVLLRGMRNIQIMDISIYNQFNINHLVE